MELESSYKHPEGTQQNNYRNSGKNMRIFNAAGQFWYLLNNQHVLVIAVGVTSSKILEQKHEKKKVNENMDFDWLIQTHEQR